MKADALAEMNWLEQFPDAPVWAVWAVVAVLALCRLRVAAVTAAWVGVAGFTVLAFVLTHQHWWSGADAGWLLLGLVTAVALTVSGGPARGRELVGRRGVLLMAATTLASVLLGTVGFHFAADTAIPTLVLAVGALAACGVGSRTGRRAALVISLPLMTFLLSRGLLDGPLEVRSALPMAVACYGVPVILLVALGLAARRRPS
ncbi:hypothetical protein GCM10029964_027690 [Kibdelosporangium lantanae]